MVLELGPCAALSLTSSGQPNLQVLLAHLSFPSSTQHLSCTGSELGPLPQRSGPEGKWESQALIK